MTDRKNEREGEKKTAKDREIREKEIERDRVREKERRDTQRERERERDRQTREITYKHKQPLIDSQCDRKTTAYLDTM